MKGTNKYLQKLKSQSIFNPIRPKDEMDSIEIVVPVFNGINALIKCIDALLLHTNQAQQITLLNDASTDQRVTDYLLTLTDQPQITVINRQQNLGYLHNVNQFLMTTKKHVLLLNSDTQVTAGWLEEMQAVASDGAVGAVCPLSDNATILTLKQNAPTTAEALLKFTGLWYPIPTAVGFCLLIKKQVLDQLGGFDPFYDPGYGEECDYSMRLREAGWQIACAPAAYVTHQGSQSFQNNASELKHQHQKLLNLRWPKYDSEVSSFMAQNPTQYIDQYLQTKLSRKKRILHVVHGIDNKGGVELFTQELLAQFGDDFHHTIIIPPRNKKFKSQTLNDCDFDLIEVPHGLSKPNHIIFNLPADLNHFNLDQYFKQTLQFGQFKMVHFHSLVGVGTAMWPLICNEINIPYFFFIHDHSGLCQIFSLSTTINNQEIFCGRDYAQYNNKQCLKCIENKTQKSKLTTQSYMELRQQIWLKIIEQAEHIQFSSEYLLNAYQLKYPQINTKSVVFSPCFYPSQQVTVNRPEPKKITLAFLGQFGILKGAQLFIDLYHSINNPGIDWLIIGGVDPKYRAQLDQTKIKTSGGYERSQLAELLQPVDLVVLTSQIPETYAITLTEAWVQGVPVVGPNLGSIGERIKPGINGYLYQHNNLNSLIETIETFLHNQSSDDAIKSIEYIQDNKTHLSSLQKKYLSVSNNTDHVTPLTVSKSHVMLAPPKNSAYESMQQWLDAPLTLEAEADWQPPPAGTQVLLLGHQPDALNLTQNNLKSQLNSPVFLSVDDLTDQQNSNSKVLLIIQAGNQINENIGNWLAHFMATDSTLGLADFALINGQQRIYAPQFYDRFSWTNHVASHQAVGCLLLKKPAWNLLEIQNLCRQPDGLQQMVQMAHQQNKISHFPHYSHTLLDQLWVQNWKLKSSKKVSKPQINYRLLICIESHLPEKELKLFKQAINRQTVVTQGHCEVLCYHAKNKQHTLSQVDDAAYSHFLLLYDNVLLLHNNCLYEMISTMSQTELSATSVPAAIDQDPNYLVAKKFGGGQYFHGIGRIRNVSFDSAGTPIEHEILDDDFMLFTRAAWQVIKQQISAPSEYYQALHLSTALHQQGFKTGIINKKNITKRGLPSHCLNYQKTDLTAARNQVIEAKKHRPNNTVYSLAYNCRHGCHLDLINTIFKTPKKLPRVVAYAHDDWASGFYRIKSPMNALAIENKISVQFMPNNHPNVVPTPYELARMQPDVLLLHGFYTDQQLTALHQYKRQLKIHLIVSIDDLLMHIPDYSPLADKVPKDVGTRIKLACSLADTLIVSTGVLATHFSNWHNNIKVIPNRLSKALWNQPSLNNKSLKLRIGWAGAGQHQGDLAWLKPLVEATYEQYDWVFFGDKPAGIDLKMIEFHAPVDLLHYANKLQQLKLHLAVAPLVNNQFNAAKSNLKLIEYGAMGIPVLATDLACYQNSPADLMPNQQVAWVRRLTEYNQNRAMLKKNGQLMRNWVEKNYWLEDHTEDWLNALQLD